MTDHRKLKNHERLQMSNTSRIKGATDFHHVFVYGTLMSGYGNNRRIEDAEFVGRAETIEPYVMLAQGIPYVFEVGHCMVDDMKSPPRYKDGRPIKGEVWKLNTDQLASCDQLEGHPIWYRRKQIKVRVHGCHRWAWIYFMQLDQNERFNCTNKMITQNEDGLWIPRVPSEDMILSDYRASHPWNKKTERK